MDRDEFEFLLSQYFDGMLSEEQRQAIDQRLRTDPDARRLLADFQRIQRIVGAPLPEIRWDLMAGEISRGIDEQTATPVYSMRLYRGIVSAGLALAACALIAFGVTRLMRPSPAGPAEISVIGPQPEMAMGNSSIEISVSEPHETATAMAYIYDDNVLTNRPVVALDTVDHSTLRQVH